MNKIQRATNGKQYKRLLICIKVCKGESGGLGSPGHVNNQITVSESLQYFLSTFLILHSSTTALYRFNDFSIMSH